MLSLDLVKQHLNIAKDFKQDDVLIMNYIETATEAVLKDIDLVNPNDAYDEDGELKKSIQQSVLLLVGTLYGFRESATYGATTRVQHALEFLDALNRDFSYREYGIL